MTPIEQRLRVVHHDACGPSHPWREPVADCCRVWSALLLAVRIQRDADACIAEELGDDMVAREIRTRP